MMNKLQAIAGDKKKLALVAMLLCVFIYIDISYVLSAQFRGVKKKGAEVKKLPNDLTMLNKDLQLLKVGSPQELSNKMPGGKRLLSAGEVSRFLGYISDTANKHELRVMQIKPSVVAVASQKTTPIVVANADLMYITIELLSSYHKLGQFINELENAPEYLSVNKLKIVSDPNDYMHQDVSLVVETYVKK